MKNIESRIAILVSRHSHCHHLCKENFISGCMCLSFSRSTLIFVDESSPFLKKNAKTHNEREKISYINSLWISESMAEKRKKIHVF